ncbi:hypothetical protein TWF788_003472 [Orbilia oligospora]|uniref:Uncharacterized protein n=1 Tax=Orbilia oligospora TaxID=2813651 RepID=A0A7C8K2V6_ORBOL|nr:hypothetical protein TWF788_003472 [Orbilia oligospora]
MTSISHSLQPRFLSFVFGILFGLALANGQEFPVDEHFHQDHVDLVVDIPDSVTITHPNDLPVGINVTDKVDIFGWIICGASVIILLICITCAICRCRWERARKMAARNDEENGVNELATFRILGGRFVNDESRESRENKEGDLREGESEKPPPYFSQCQELPPYTSTSIHDY